MIPFPKKKYNIIYADPAWYFKTYSDKGNKRSALQHYNCLNIDDIFNLPVNTICNNDCVLFLWAIDPMLPEALETIKRWGFKYSTIGFNWVKRNKNFALGNDNFFVGMGWWTRANSELCLIAKKGSIKRQTRSIHQLIYEPIREHSRKPDCVRDRIVQLCGDLPRIELFARQRVDGWDCWGNQV